MTYHKLYGWLRRLRLLHFTNNVLNYNKLRANKLFYKKYGIKKSIFGSIAHIDFKTSYNEKPWLDEPNAMEKLVAHPQFKEFSSEIQESLKQWPEKGYLILNTFFNEAQIDKIVAETEALKQNGAIKYDYTHSRFMNAWKHSAAVKNCISDPGLLKLLSFVLNKRVIPFQTISFFKGSQQNSHSDFVHMTTAPEGYLIAAWIALEDISLESGPLHYYPGSHKLPVVLGEHFENENNSLTIDDDFYLKYERKIASVVESSKLKKEIFQAKKGDVLIWHANLIHGGEKVINPQLSRKSLVAHYFCEGVFNYHEITQRPAIIEDIFEE